MKVEALIKNIEDFITKLASKSNSSVTRRKTPARRPRPGDDGFFSLLLELILLGVAT